MATVKNKRELRTIARRWAKGLLLAGTAEAFTDTGLTHEEQDEISAEVVRIANRITSEPQAIDSIALIEEYYEDITPKR